MLGCASCGGDCGMGMIATVGLGATCGYDDYGNPTDCRDIAGQSTDPGSTSVGNSWSNVWQRGVITAFNIAGSRYGGVQPGQYTQNGNSINYRLPNNSTNFSAFPSAGIGVSSSLGGLVPYAIGGVLLIAAIKAFKN